MTGISLITGFSGSFVVSASNVGKVDYKDLINKPAITSSSFPAPQASDAGKIVTVNSTGNDLEYSPLAKQIVSTTYTEYEQFSASTSLTLRELDMLEVRIVPDSSSSKMFLNLYMFYGCGTHNLFLRGVVRRRILQGSSSVERVSIADVVKNTSSQAASGNRTPATFAHCPGIHDAQNMGISDGTGFPPYAVHNVGFNYLDDNWSENWQPGDTVVYSVHADVWDKVWYINGPASLLTFAGVGLPVSTFTAQEY